MGSAFLCAALGIEPSARHADYLGSWLAVLREDNRAIFRAASLASKAAEWLLARYGEAGADSTAHEGRAAACCALPPTRTEERRGGKGGGGSGRLKGRQKINK